MYAYSVQPALTIAVFIIFLLGLDPLRQNSAIFIVNRGFLQKIPIMKFIWNCTTNLIQMLGNTKNINEMSKPYQYRLFSHRPEQVLFLIFVNEPKIEKTHI